MANKLYCDRCGEDCTFSNADLGKKGDGLLRTISIKVGMNLLSWDLCPACCEHFEQRLDADGLRFTGGEAKTADSRRVVSSVNRPGWTPTK